MLVRISYNSINKMTEETLILRRNLATLDRLVEKFVALTGGGVKYGELRFASARKVSRYLSLIMSKDVGPYFWSSFNMGCNEVAGGNYNKGMFSAETEDTTVGPYNKKIRVIFYQPYTKKR